ncbi:MAG: nucleotidyltransferase protein [Proteobacteria bacterium]|nr:nucleotidyltransferase protein [Pseudomonadota bacterium]
MNDPLLQAIVDELVASHGAHTIVLYGSRADGSASAGSDYDIAAFAAIERATRITRPVGDTFLDVFIYPEAQLETTPVEFLKLVGGRVLVERDDAGRRLVERADRLLQAGPEPLPPDERRALQDWARKMLVRMQRGDAEGHYRRAWLLMELLPDYFQLRGLWYRGPKKSFAWLAGHDPVAHAAFLAALTPGAPDEAIRALVDAVLSGQTD